MLLGESRNKRSIFTNNDDRTRKYESKNKKF